MAESRPQLQCIAQQKSRQPHSSGNVASRSARTGQWTADGTCIVQTTPDNTIETIVLPDNLLDGEDGHELKPFSRHVSPDPIYAVALYPHFSLGSPTTTLALHAARSTPIQLRNALSYEQGIYATYPWFDPNTEEAITPHSMIFDRDATHFIAGSRAKFAIFDVNRPQGAAIRVRATSKSRKAVKTYGPDPLLNATGPQSYITTMDNNSEDVLAFGTNTRHVALYADHGLGDKISSFQLADTSTNGSISGKGITQVKWTPDGTYLFVAERQSDTIEVFDMRHNRQRLSWLSGRKAFANFQLSFDIIPTLHGLEVWAGGIDGLVRLWSNPEQQQGEVESTEHWHVHDDPVCSTLVHSSGSIMASLSLKDRHKTPSSPLSDVSSESDDSSGQADSLSDADHTGDNSSEEERSIGSSTATKVTPQADAVPTLKIWAIQ